MTDILRITLSQDTLPDERLDRALAENADRLSRTSAAKLIREGNVLVNGEVVKKSAFVVAPGDEICAHIPEPNPLQVMPRAIPLDILYEDDDLLVVNKPKGMVVHPAAGHTDDTLVNAVLAHCGDTLSGIGGTLRPGIVHRIDKDTTGALLVCKNDRTHAALASQLKAHTLQREYVAIAHGIVKEDSMTIDRALGRSKTDRKKMAVENNGRGKKAVTHVRVLRRFEKDRLSYLSCTLETGRTHQIRVHLSSAGFPLLGDSVYAGKRKSRFTGLTGQCLHAKTLGFVHPASGKFLLIEAPLPPYFVDLLEKMM